MESEPRYNVTPRTVVGLSLVTIGLALTLDRLGLVDAGRLFRFWPVPIIAVGALMLVQARDGHDRFRGAVFTFVGMWLFLSVQGILRVSLWQLIGPVVLTLFGARLLLMSDARWSERRRERWNRRTRDRWGIPSSPEAEGGDGPSADGRSSAFTQAPAADRERRRARGFTMESSERVSLFSVMSHVKRASNAPAFRGGDITAIMGGCQLDLRLATIPPGEEAVIDIVTVMGGVELFAPPHWEISTPLVPFMGGVEDRRLPPLRDDAGEATPVPRLVLRGFALMGGVEIK